jgi:uroporphyrinogen decarboxylase
MNEKQRVKAHIHFQDTDRIPWQIGYTSELGAKLMEALGLELDEHEVLGKNIFTFNRLDDYLGNHLAFVRNRAVNSLQEVEHYIFRDEWKVLWDRSIDRDIGTPVNCILERMDLDSLEIPDPLNPDRFAHFAPLIKANAHRYLLVKFSYSLFERAWSLRGMENLLMDMVQNPSFVHELLDFITDYNLKLIDHISQYDVDGIYFGDDWGYQLGMLMSPDMWRTFIKPRIKRLYDQTHELEWDVFIHSCGNISAVLDDLVEIGLNVFNPFQPEVIDIEEVIDRYAGRLAFYGGLSIQKTLPFGSAEEVRDEVQHRLGLSRKYSGFIVSPSHDMPPDIPVENVLAMLETLAECGNNSVTTPRRQG